MDDPLWDRVDVDHWQQTPGFRGRIAVEQDVKDGRAVFYFRNGEEIGAVHVDIGLLHCAIVSVEGAEFPAVVINRSALITSITSAIGRSGAGTGSVCFPKSSYCLSQMRDFNNRPNQTLQRPPP
jgi:hypothetical protein